jgi:hypothetical protein
MSLISLTENELELKSCQPSCSKKEPCIQKCCPLGFIFDITTSPPGCIESGVTKWSPKLFKVPSNPSTLISVEELVETGILPRYFIRWPSSWAYNCYENATLMHPYSEDVAGALGMEALKYDYLR